MRAFLFFMSYLVCAIALEIAILPQLRIVTPWVLAPLLDLQLLAMAGVLAGLLRGVRPIGVWSMTIIFEKFSAPRISSCAPGRSLEPYHWRNSARRMMSSTSVLLPEPLTPVTHVSVPIGKRAVRF